MKNDFKFIEIGSNHIDTLIHEYGMKVKGLLVEPIKESFDLIPTSNTIFKENCAITNKNGTIDLHIHFDKSKVYKWKFVTRKYLKKYGFHLCGGSDLTSIDPTWRKTNKKRQVNCMTFKSLIEKYNIGSVDVLKIDTEGHDHIILNDVYECLKSGQFKINEMLRYEKNELSSHKELKEISDKIKLLCNFTNEEYKESIMEVFLNKK